MIKGFELYELVTEEAYNNYPERLLWRLIDKDALKLIEKVRSRYGRMLCNTWWWGGKWQGRGLRWPNSGDLTSQHAFGRAFDLIPLDADVDTIREDMIRSPHWWPEVTGIEADVTWLHIDTRTLMPGIRRPFVFKP